MSIKSSSISTGVALNTLSIITCCFLQSKKWNWLCNIVIIGLRFTRAHLCYFCGKCVVFVTFCCHWQFKKGRCDSLETPLDGRPLPNCIREIVTQLSFHLTVTNSQLEEGADRHTEANTQMHTQFVFSPKAADILDNSKTMGRIHYCKQCAFNLLGASVVMEAINVNCSLWNCGTGIHHMKTSVFPLSALMVDSIT